MKTLVTLAVVAGLLIGLATQSVFAEQPSHRDLTPVPFTDVKVQDTFWAPRLKTNREKSLPHNFKWCEETGRFANFAKAAGLEKGKFEGIYFNDSDVYKVLEGASYSLADHPDPKLAARTDRVISLIAAAQQPNGYLNTYYTLVEPDKKWTNLASKHELYCAGHLIEAAVAHHRATGKETLLNVAIALADRIDTIFGPGKRVGVPGHEEIELALVKLYGLTGEQRYLHLADFFLKARGDKTDRQTVFGPYCQDHVPVSEQAEIVGHAVRAMYLYSGVADVASYTGNTGFIKAMDRLWNDVVLHKMYITGGIGARHQGEAFGDAYELPNESAYCETCAAIGLALWNHRLNTMHADARYIDVLERVIYNGMLSGVGMDWTHFFYVNPLASDGRHHRKPFFPCACCPTKVVRFLPSLPGYIYATAENAVYVNLFVGSTARLTVNGTPISLKQTTRYPWDGHVSLQLGIMTPREFDINVRIPGWCDKATIAMNGQPIDHLEIVKGYAVLRHTWKQDDQIDVTFPMKVQHIEAHPRVVADRGRVAVQRGPLVYCFEAVDNGGRVRNLMLDRNPDFQTEFRSDLLGGVVVIRAGVRGDRTATAVPYYAWDHRKPGAMAVWIRQDGKNRQPNVQDETWRKKLYRTLDPAKLGPSQPLTIADISTPTASYCHPSDSLLAIIDGIEPTNSCDHSVPRMTWWNHIGSAEWVQYEFDQPITVGSVAVYWFDDAPRNGGCRTPKSWKLLYRQGDQWKPVTTNAQPGTTIDRYNHLSFTPVKTTALRIQLQLKKGYSGGILEWKVQAN